MGTTLKYLGWDAFIVTSSAGKKVLIDPFLSGNPNNGIKASPETVDTLEPVDVIAVTHSAGDHFGDTVAILAKCDAKLLCGPDVVHIAGKAGIAAARIHVMVQGAAFTLGDMTIKALDARHVSMKVMDGYTVAGPPLSYLVRTEGGASIFHGGDTAVTSDMRLYGELYKPAVALLGIGGATLNGRLVTEMDPSEAAFAAGLLGVKVAIPMHYQTTGEVTEFVNQLKALGSSASARVMEPLDEWSVGV